MRHDNTGLPADLLRGHAEQHEVGVVTVETAVTVHRVGARRTYFWVHWVHFVSELYQEVSPCEPGRTTLHVSQIFKCQEVTICRKKKKNPPATIPPTKHQN